MTTITLEQMKAALAKVWGASYKAVLAKLEPADA